MRENKIGGIPVVDGNNILIGIVTNRDLRFQRDMMRRIEEVMTPGDRLITTHSTGIVARVGGAAQQQDRKAPRGGRQGPSGGAYYL